MEEDTCTIKKTKKRGYRVEKSQKIIDFLLWVPIFCHRTWDLFLTLRGVAFPPFPPPLAHVWLLLYFLPFHCTVLVESLLLLLLLFPLLLLTDFAFCRQIPVAFFQVLPRPLRPHPRDAAHAGPGRRQRRPLRVRRRRRHLLP